MSTMPLARCAWKERIEVGMITASEVPTQSGMRTSSGTPMTRNTSYRIGTMTAPPPTPKTPARRPVSAPAAISETARKTRSPVGIPASMSRIRQKGRLLWAISCSGASTPWRSGYAVEPAAGPAAQAVASKSDADNDPPACLGCTAAPAPSPLAPATAAPMICNLASAPGKRRRRTREESPETTKGRRQADCNNNNHGR